MPLPIAHSLLAGAMYETSPVANSRTGWKMLLLFAVLACLPDIDFLPGFLMGEPGRFHRHYLSHSLGAAIVVGFITATVYCWWKKERFLQFFLLFSCVYFSHVALDYFSMDSHFPYGVPMFWPLSDSYVVAQTPIFLAIKKPGTSAQFFQNLMSLHNLLAVLWEVVVFVPVFAAIRFFKKRRQVVLTVEFAESAENQQIPATIQE